MMDFDDIRKEDNLAGGVMRRLEQAKRVFVCSAAAGIIGTHGLAGRVGAAEPVHGAAWSRVPGVALSDEAAQLPEGRLPGEQGQEIRLASLPASRTKFRETIDRLTDMLQRIRLEVFKEHGEEPHRRMMQVMEDFIKKCEPGTPADMESMQKRYAMKKKRNT